MNNLSNYVGELSALLAAFLWAASSVIYSLLGQKISPLKLNFLKGTIAIVFILVTLFFQENFFNSLDIYSGFLLFTSGVIGIGLGDTAYFITLNNLGVRNTLLLETLAPPLSAFLAWIFIGETLDTMAWTGILLTLLGIIWVISERTPVNNNLYRLKGVLWGIVAAASQSGGAVLSRIGLLNSEISALESSLIRLFAGTITAFILLFISRKKKISLKSWEFLPIHTLLTIILAAFSGTYLGIWLQQTSLKLAPTGIAQTLLATSPIFAIIIAVIIREKVTLRSFLGVLMAIIGIGLLFVNK